MSRKSVLLAATIVLLLTTNVALAAKDLRASIRPTWNEDRVLTILVIGSDAGIPRSGDPRTGRSDAVHIIAVDTRTLKATIVDIPRDSFIAGSKINAFMSEGGPQRLKSVLTSHTGIKLDYYVLTNFWGLRSMIDDLGGVEIKLDRAIRDAAARANLPAGQQRLTGPEALAFSRARKTLPDGDFSRTQNHGELLRAAHRRIREQHADLPALTSLLGSFSRNVDTDIPPTQLFRLASLAVQVQPKNVKQVSLSGGNGFAGAEAVVYLNPGTAFSDIRKGRIGP